MARLDQVISQGLVQPLFAGRVQQVKYSVRS